MPNKKYWNTVGEIMNFTQELTSENMQEDIKKREDEASDKPMEEITLGGLISEFFEVAGETMRDYHNAKSDEERAHILKEVHDVGADVFGTIAEEVSEAGAYLKQRFQDLEEENHQFAEDMEDILASRSKNYNLTDDNTVESWLRTQPVLGDHIRVKRCSGLYYHHGIYIGNNKVIHFAPPEGCEIINWSEAEVIETSLSEFLKAGEVEVRQYTDAELMELYSPRKIVQNAQHCLGYKNYNLIFNNCEHFANSCTTGKHRCP